MLRPFVIVLAMLGWTWAYHLKGKTTTTQRTTGVTPPVPDNCAKVFVLFNNTDASAPSVRKLVLPTGMAMEALYFVSPFDTSGSACSLIADVYTNGFWRQKRLEPDQLSINAYLYLLSMEPTDHATVEVSCMQPLVVKDVNIYLRISLNLGREDLSVTTPDWRNDWLEQKRKFTACGRPFDEGDTNTLTTARISGHNTSLICVHKERKCLILGPTLLWKAAPPYLCGALGSTVTSSGHKISVGVSRKGGILVSYDFGNSWFSKELTMDEMTGVDLAASQRYDLRLDQTFAVPNLLTSITASYMESSQLILFEAIGAAALWKMQEPPNLNRPLNPQVAMIMEVPCMEPYGMLPVTVPSLPDDTEILAHPTSNQESGYASGYRTSLAVSSSICTRREYITTKTTSSPHMSAFTVCYWIKIKLEFTRANLINVYGEIVGENALSMVIYNSYNPEQLIGHYSYSLLMQGSSDHVYSQFSVVPESVVTGVNWQHECWTWENVGGQFHVFAELRGLWSDLSRQKDPIGQDFTIDSGHVVMMQAQKYPFGEFDNNNCLVGFLGGMDWWDFAMEPDHLPQAGCSMRGNIWSMTAESTIVEGDLQCHNMTVECPTHTTGDISVVRTP